MRPKLISKRGAVAVLLCLLLGVIVVVVIRFSEPFSFLHGRLPLRSKVNSYESFYSFRGDFDEVNRRAAKELARHGFVRVTDFQVGEWRGIRYEIPRTPGQAYKSDYVILWQNMHYRLPRPGDYYLIVPEHETGWVSVKLSSESPPNKLTVWIRKLRTRFKF